MQRSGWIYTIFIIVLTSLSWQEGQGSGYSFNPNDAANMNPPPNITLYTLSGKLLQEETFDILEQSPVNTVIAPILAEYFNEEEDARFSCTSDSRWLDLQLRMKEQSLQFYTIVNKQIIDREEINRFGFTITCLGYGNPSFNTSVLINVNVLDINDNNPMFPRDAYEFDIVENNEPGSIISTVNAVDADEDENGLITYQLEPDAAHMFAIDSSTGVIKTKVSFDRELLERCTFLVLAKDHGIPERTGTATIQINIKDVNDNAPVFINQEFDFDISGNIANGTAVARVLAYDRDKSTDGLVFSMAPYYRNLLINFPFEVISNGTIVTTTEINLEEVMIFLFLVIVEDTGAPISHSSSAMVRITYRPEEIPGET